jgi:hypothetical protein
MTRLIDRIKDTLQGTSHEHDHDHESVGANGHADEQVAAPQASEREHGGEQEHNKKGHKHC